MKCVCNKCGFTMDEVWTTASERKFNGHDCKEYLKQKIKELG